MIANYRAEFDNGSTDTDRVQHLSLQIRAREHQINQAENARRLKVEQAGVNTAKLSRAIARARHTALNSVTNDKADKTDKADKAIRLARSFTSNPNTTLPTPDLDFTRLDLVAQQATELTAHQKHLEKTLAKDASNDYDEDLFTYLQNDN